MSDKPTRIERLNAYIDGELAPADAADVAAEIAGDAQASRVVANLHGLKSALSTAFEPDDVPSGEVSRGDRPTRRRGRGVAVAGLAVLAMAVVAWWTMGLNTMRAHDLVATALEVHDGWEQASARPAAHRVVPDLRLAGLRVAGRTADVALGPLRATRIAYVGRNGCRLSLYAFARDENTAQPVSQRSTDALVESWSVGAYGYLLVARQMNETRFGVIAEALKQATARAVPVVPGMRTAMAGARQPCRA